MYSSVSANRGSRFIDNSCIGIHNDSGTFIIGGRGHPPWTSGAGWCWRKSNFIPAADGCTVFMWIKLHSYAFKMLLQLFTKDGMLFSQGLSQNVTSFRSPCGSTKGTEGFSKALDIGDARNEISRNLGKREPKDEILVNVYFNSIILFRMMIGMLVARAAKMREGKKRRT